jgi:hypothetical protein
MWSHVRMRPSKGGKPLSGRGRHGWLATRASALHGPVSHPVWQKGRLL